jgi:hypothetical protein
MKWTSGGGIRGNHWTDHGVVTVGCGQEACVTLYAPSAHNCGLGWLHVLDGLRNVDVIPAKLAEEAMEVTKAVLERVPRSNFDVATQDTQIELLKAAEETKPDRPEADPEPKKG